MIGSILVGCIIAGWFISKPVIRLHRKYIIIK